MIVKEFLKITRSDLDEKGNKKFWNDSELFNKLKSAYNTLQGDLPFFVYSQTLQTQEGITEYRLKHEPIKEVICRYGGKEIAYDIYDAIHSDTDEKLYTFYGEFLVLNFIPENEIDIEITYKYAKDITSLNCSIEVPMKYHKALKYLLKSEIYEKPKLNSKDRIF